MRPQMNRGGKRQARSHATTYGKGYSCSHRRHRTNAYDRATVSFMARRVGMWLASRYCTEGRNVGSAGDQTYDSMDMLGRRGGCDNRFLVVGGRERWRQYPIAGNARYRLNGASIAPPGAGSCNGLNIPRHGSQYLGRQQACRVDIPGLRRGGTHPARQ